MGAHHRVYAAKGRAMFWWCEHCDSRADGWAYDNRDPNELTAERVPGAKPLRYSLDPDHYFPLCASCHASFDAAERAVL